MQFYKKNHSGCQHLRTKQFGGPNYWISAFSEGNKTVKIQVKKVPWNLAQKSKLIFMWASFLKTHLPAPLPWLCVWHILISFVSFAVLLLQCFPPPPHLFFPDKSGSQSWMTRKLSKLSSVWNSVCINVLPTWCAKTWIIICYYMEKDGFDTKMWNVFRWFHCSVGLRFNFSLP